MGYGGMPIKQHKDILKNDTPHCVVGTPGRIQQLIREGDLKLDKVKHFILDECDQMLEALDMRKDVQEIFKKTPREKQVMFFSATLSQEIRAVCKKFMQDPMEIYVDNESKLTFTACSSTTSSWRRHRKIGSSMICSMLWSLTRS